MSRRATRAPYAVGDWAYILRDDTVGTTWGALRVERVTALSDGRTWRIGAIRHNGAPVEVLVGSNGRDAHGYVEPAGALEPLELLPTRDEPAAAAEPAPAAQQLALEGIALAVTETTRDGEQPSMFGATS
jgi:hypothetical protein